MSKTKLYIVTIVTKKLSRIISKLQLVFNKVYNLDFKAKQVHVVR